MIKVLIVDDEEIIRSGLCSGIDWESIGVCPLPPAGSAEEAIKTAENTKPDILITDISMPDINGIELIDILTKKHPDIKSIILSGYDSFEYAKNAIELKVDKYLLKPVDPDILKETVKSLIENVQNTKSHNELYGLYEKKFFENFENLKLNFIKNTMFENNDGIDILKEKKIFNIAADKPNYIVMCIDINTSEDNADKKAYASFAFDAIELFTDNSFETYVISSNSKQSVVILFCNDAQKLDKAAKNIIDYIKNTLRLLANFGISNTQNDFELLPNAYTEAYETLTHSLLTDGNIIAIPKENNELINNIKNYINENYNRKITLSEIAKQFHISYSHLSLLFKRETGRNISEYLGSVRIENAKRLLENNSIRIQEVSSKVGIDDNHYFSRLFKKMTGFTPKQYKKNSVKK